MNARIVITASGEVAVFVEDGTFAEGAEKLEALWALLEADGVDFDKVELPEQHKHDTAHAHQHAYNIGHEHTH